MDSFELNKFVGAALFSLLVVLALGNLSTILINPGETEKVAFPVPTPEPGAEAPAAAAAETGDSLASLLSQATVEKGQKLAKKCAACHTFEQGAANKIGPNLYGILGDPVARQPDFKYSGALAEHGGTWDYDSLNAFLTKPKEYVPGTKMTFPGFKKPKDRASVILYLRSLGDSETPLPSE